MGQCGAFLQFLVNMVHSGRGGGGGSPPWTTSPPPLDPLPPLPPPLKQRPGGGGSGPPIHVDRIASSPSAWAGGGGAGLQLSWGRVGGVAK